ncbi:hypothetical protein LA080_010986 [Diaporthe eres]|uniref:Uncharacterized protein n=1 Tax=Diaporthe vaccinii TaxID=105482 RepID=A0ABR4EDJ7_9PEZI|nr:hypothetical protein LA080_010986 [Diaporthe eres]
MADDNAAAQNDPNVSQPGYYPATDHAIPYQSEWSRLHDDEATKATLRHLGCNYLGTPGCPPTLIALKRHAQSLAVLIARLSPSVRTGKVDGNPIFDDRQVGRDQYGAANIQHSVEGRLELNDAFDWLADLSQPYNNDDPNHHKPLNILSNEVSGRHEVAGTEFKCPIESFPVREPLEQRAHPYLPDVSQLPHASHHLLAMHANQCLELLDHEFSNTGGILSLIPEEGQGANSAELKAAQNSLLGQLLLYVQSLALRNHEMDMTNAKLTDALASEAVVPLQHLSVLGPDGRSGREIAYPQDRWVLVNAGDDVWAHLHDAMDREEAALDVREHEWAQEDAGLGGDSVWSTERSQGRHARGLVAVDIRSRFYRLQGQGRSTIFVLPAFATQPSTEWSERLDRYSKPTVVGTVAPRTVQRATDYQKRQDRDHAAEMRRQTRFSELQTDSARDKGTIDHLRNEAARNAQVQKNMSTQLAQYTNRQPAEGQQNNEDLIASLHSTIAALQLAAQQQHSPQGVRFADAVMSGANGP